MNISLLCKWWWKLENDNGIWQDIVKAKYLRNDLVTTVKHRVDDSPVWSDLLKVKHIYIRGRRIKPNNGENTLFWVDPWLDDEPLYSKSSILFELCNDKKITLNKFIESRGQVEFRRWLPSILHEQWEWLKAIALEYHLITSPDTIS